MKKVLCAGGLIFVFFFAVFPVQSSAKTYYCYESVSTGFIKDKNTRKFRDADFKPGRFAIQFSPDFEELKGLYEDEIFNCTRPYSSTTDILSCISPWKDGAAFLFDAETGRFELLKPSMFGYVNNGTDTSAFSIGVCEKF